MGEQRRLINATCPECRGPLSAVTTGGIVEYQCLIGHRYSPQGLLIAMDNVLRIELRFGQPICRGAHAGSTPLKKVLESVVTTDCTLVPAVRDR